VHKEKVDKDKDLDFYDEGLHDGLTENYIDQDD
jgi:hypothetical protein